MASTTTRYALPYPSPTDNNNVPADMQALAQATDTKLGSVVDQLIPDAVQAGVVTGGEVTYVSATSVSVAAGTGWIDGGGASGLNGRYRVTWPTTTLTVPQAATGLSRLDQIVVAVPSVGHGSSTPTRLAGTDAGTVTLDGRQSAATLPAGRIRLADVLTIQSAGGVATSTIRDRRLRAVGLRHRFIKTVGGSNTTTGVGSVNATPLFGGTADFRCELKANSLVQIGMMARDATTSNTQWLKLVVAANGAPDIVLKEWDLPHNGFSFVYHYVPSADGTYLFKWQHFLTNTGTGVVDAYAAGGAVVGWAVEYITPGGVSNNGII